MLIFISGLLISFVLFRLGSYAALLAMITTGSKVIVALAIAVAIALSIRKYLTSRRMVKLPGRSGQ